jgi:hypothetical protein
MRGEIVKVRDLKKALEGLDDDQDLIIEPVQSFVIKPIAKEEE